MFLHFNQFIRRNPIRTFGDGAVPGGSSMTNSTSLSGGMPGNSSGKTSRNSHTTGTSSREGVDVALAAYSCDCRSLGEICKVLPSGLARETVLWAKSIYAPYLDSQFMPRIISMLADFSRMRVVKNSTPSRIMLTPSHSSSVLCSEPGE